MLIALVIYSYFIKKLQNKGELFKQKPVIGYKSVIFYTFAVFQYIVTIKGLNILFVINSVYNRIKI